MKNTLIPPRVDSTLAGIKFFDSRVDSTVDSRQFRVAAIKSSCRNQRNQKDYRDTHIRCFIRIYARVNPLIRVLKGFRQELIPGA